MFLFWITLSFCYVIWTAFEADSLAKPPNRLPPCGHELRRRSIKLGVEHVSVDEWLPLRVREFSLFVQPSLHAVSRQAIRKTPWCDLLCRTWLSVTGFCFSNGLLPSSEQRCVSFAFNASRSHSMRVYVMPRFIRRTLSGYEDRLFHFVVR